MQNKLDLPALARRLSELRTQMLTLYPFYGRLLLRLQFGFAACGTAFTDMRRIVFDPRFASALSDAELRFVLLHEVLHCVLHHCTRGRTLQQQLYNVACDIVVNSLLLETLGAEDFAVAGEKVMHLTPDGSEGRLYNAEEVYELLLRMPPREKERLDDAPALDTHIVWQQISDEECDDLWEEFLRAAGGSAESGSGIPCGLRRYLREISHSPKTNWRQLLHDFIQQDRSDYTFAAPDHRFQGELILPSFQEKLFGEKVERLWFLIDTSASISEDALAEAFCEIRDALDQIDNLSGELSFFDTAVTEPAPFSSVTELQEILPTGGGGTSFAAIFDSMRAFYPDELPVAVLILTDGYADFPEEAAACGVPVLWIMIDSPRDAPWGESIHVESED